MAWSAEASVAPVVSSPHEPRELVVQGRVSSRIVTLEPPREGLCVDPNAGAPPNRLELLPGVALVDGYQQYWVTRHSIRCGPRHPATQAKARLLTDWMTPRFLAGRSLLDLGGNAGFHSLWALQQGAVRATVVDIDAQALESGRRAAEHVGIEGLSTVQKNVAEWEEPADVVLALALVHWTHSCTALFRSVGGFVERIAALTRYLAFVEWVAPDDPLVARFGHLEWNRESGSAPYAEKDFVEALHRGFGRVEVVGEVSPTRRLYAAFRGHHEIDLSGSMPKLFASDTLLASRNVSRFRGMDHWSRAYRGPGVGEFTKQTSFDQAHHEFVILRRLSGPYFPRALREAAEEGGSSVTLEAIEGVALAAGTQEVIRSEAFSVLVGHCLAILRALRAVGIQHRDIRDENVLLRHGAPVLIDFGWASTADLPTITPLLLGLAGRPPDGSFCDVFSVGRMLGDTKGSAFPEWNSLLTLMTEPDGRCRLTDLDTLELLADIAASRAQHPKDGDMGEAKQAVSELADRAAALSQRASAQERRLAETDQELLRRQEGMDVLSARFFEAQTVTENLWAEIRARDADRQALREILERKESDIAELRAALDAKDRHILAADGQVDELNRRLHAAEVELNTKLWRKVASYLRRRIRGS